MFPLPPGAGSRRRSGLVLGVLLLVVCGLVAGPLSSVALAAPLDGSTDENGTATPTDGTDGERGMTIDAALERDADADTVEVIVRLSDAAIGPAETPARAASRLKRHAERTQGDVVSYARATDGVTVENRFWVTNAVLLEVDTDRVDLESFGRFEDVSTLHTNFEVELDGAVATGASTVSGGTTSTTDGAATDGASSTDGLERINAPAVWNEYGANGTGARVAVLDTGVDVTHPDIDLHTSDPSNPTYPGGWAEFDRYGNRVQGSTPRDFGDHGTHVSGTVAGGAASGTHIGVAPGVELLHGAVLTNCDGGCRGTYSQVIGGIQWAVEADADVVSMSLGVRAYEERFIDPIRNAQSAGTLVVSSAGNDGDGTSGSPANVYETFAVGAATGSGGIADFSSGETITTETAWSAPPDDWPDAYTVPDVAAPGTVVYSSVPGGSYQYKSGTSMAAPHVAGSIALLHSVNPALHPAEITAALEETAWKLDGAPAGQDTRYGHGIVDVKAAADATSLVTVAGTVTDRANEPIANATVAVDGGRWTATTGDDGRYELRVVPGERTLSVSAAGHRSTTESIALLAGGTVARDVTLDFVALSAGEELPALLEANDTVSTTFDVAGDLETLTVTTAGNATLEPNAIEFSVDGTRFAPNETAALESAVSDDRVTVTTHLESGANGTLELDYAFGRGNETQTVRTGPATVVPAIYEVGVVADADDATGDRLRADLADELPVAYRTSRVSTADAVAAAESGAYDVFVALELPAADDANATRTFVDATAADGTGVLYLGTGAADDALGRLARHTAAIDRLEATGHDGPVEVVVDAPHPYFAGVGAERDAVRVLENASDRAWFDAPGARPLASATDDGVLADGTAIALDRPNARALLGFSPRNGTLTADGRAIVANAVEYFGAGRFHVIDDLETYGVSGGPPESATFAVPDAGPVAVDLATGTTVDSANVTLTVNGTEIAPGDSVPVDAETAGRGLTVDVTVADGVDGESVRLAAAFENETVVTSPIRFETEPPARYAGTVAVNGEPARDGLAVRATYDGIVVAETVTANGRYGIPAASGGGGVLEVNASRVPENATLNVSIGNAETSASPVWNAGEQARTDLSVAYDDPFAAATVSAPRWTAAGEEIDVSMAFDGGARQYLTDRAWLGAYGTDPANRWAATHAFSPDDEGIATVGARLTDLAGETRTVSTRVLVIDGNVTTVNGTITRPATEQDPSAVTDATEVGVDGSILLAPAHGNWTDERPVENGTFEAATEENASTHGVFLERSGAYPIYQTVFDRVVGDETVAVELADGHELAVEVTDEDGEAVANASVAVTPADGGRTDAAVVRRETRTDAAGRWTGPNGDGLGALVDGTVTITVRPPADAGYVDETIVRTLSIDEATTATFELANRPERDGSGGGGSGGGFGGGSMRSPGEVLRLDSTTQPDGSALLELTGTRARIPAETALTGVGADGVSFERVEIGIVPSTLSSPATIAFRPGDRGEADQADGAVTYANFDGRLSDRVAAVSLTFAVDDEVLPAGTAPEDVVVSEYRGGRWRSVETTHDSGAGTHTATFSGLNPVAIGVRTAAPAFELVDSRIERIDGRDGDSVRIEATIENVGDVAGSDAVTLAADGETLATERIELAPGERDTIAVETTLESESTVTLDGASLGTVTVAGNWVAAHSGPNGSAGDNATGGTGGVDGSSTADAAASDPSTSDSATGGSSTDDSSRRSDTVPGFGVFVAIVAIAIGVLGRARGRPPAQ